MTPKEDDPRIAKCGFQKGHQSFTHKGDFKKGHIPWNKDLKGEEYLGHYPNGQVWNKGKKTGQIPWNKGRKGYRLRLTSKGLERKRRTSNLFKDGHQHSSKVITKIKKARLQQVIPAKDTKIEIRMQNALKERNIIFETHYPVIGQPDIAFPENKVVVFCDGCYWHGCPIHFPERRQERVEIDQRIQQHLSEEGWQVLRFWGHEINENLEECVNKVMEVTKCG